MSQSNIGTIHVVVADDDPGTARWLSTCIERHWGERACVKAFIDPVQACDWLEDHPCEILVTDLQMPVMNGLDLARRARVKSPLVQVIFISAEPDVDSVVQAAQDGASDFLVKPVDPAALVDRLNKAGDRVGCWLDTLAESLAKAWPAPPAEHAK
jgi:DNA-binding NtrC family response regulator